MIGQIFVNTHHLQQGLVSLIFQVGPPLFTLHIDSPPHQLRGQANVLPLPADGQRQLIVGYDHEQRIGLLVDHNHADMGGRQSVIHIFGRIGAPGNDIDALTLQFLNDVLHPAALHPDTGADRVDIGLGRTDRYFCPKSRLPADTHDLDDAFGNFRDFELEQLFEKLIGGARQDQLGIPTVLAHLQQVGANPVALLERAFRYLMFFG